MEGNNEVISKFKKLNKLYKKSVFVVPIGLACGLLCLGVLSVLGFCLGLFGFYKIFKLESKIYSKRNELKTLLNSQKTCVNSNANVLENAVQRDKEQCSSKKACSVDNSQNDDVSLFDDIDNLYGKLSNSVLLCFVLPVLLLMSVSFGGGLAQPLSWFFFGCTVISAGRACLLNDKIANKCKEFKNLVSMQMDRDRELNTNILENTLPEDKTQSLSKSRFAYDSSRGISMEPLTSDRDEEISKGFTRGRRK